MLDHDTETLPTDDDLSSPSPSPSFDLAISRTGPPPEHERALDKSSNSCVRRRSSRVLELVMEQPQAPQPQPQDDDDDLSQPPPLALDQRLAQRVARAPARYFWGSFLSVLVLSVLSIVLGDFTIHVKMDGFPSRGTLIANRQSQMHLVNRNKGELRRPDSDCLWEDLTERVQLGWEMNNKEEANEERRATTGCEIGGRRRRLEDLEEQQVWLEAEAMATAWQQKQQQEVQAAAQQDEEETIARRVLYDRKNLTTILEDCNVEKMYSAEELGRERLWPVWKLKDNDPEASILDPPRLQELCQAEENTLRILEQEGFCDGCDEEGRQCLPPYSPVLYARFMVHNGFVKSCEDLAAEWAPLQAETEQHWMECLAYIKQVGAHEWARDRGPCPAIFAPSLVDIDFDQTGKARLTSSIFMTREGTGHDQYIVSDQFDRGTSKLEGAYDTQYFKFLEIYANRIVFRDAALAFASGFITTMAMLAHTRSPLLTLVGIIQIFLSFPLAYGIYHFLGGVTFFPFLNLIGLFVAFALGADHIFVAVDKWKNARRERPNATTEEVAIMALPSAARAMVLTTITTSVAFFGSAMCPIAPIRLFAVFCGCVIIVDYIVDVLVMFPCLCIYDGYRHTPNWCIDWRSRKPKEQKEDHELEISTSESNSTNETPRTGNANRQGGTPPSGEKDDDVKPNLIQRILNAYYNVLHSCRWPLLVVCMASLAICIYASTKFELPVSSTSLQILDKDVEYEKVRFWRMELYSHIMMIEAGSTAQVVWGLTPTDTGDHNNPLKWTTLELDESFDPSSEEAQLYMRGFCDTFFDQEFANLEKADSICVYRRMDDWLYQQSDLPLESRHPIYRDHCDGAAGLPVPPESFHSCVSHWGHYQGGEDILSWNGTVKVVVYPFNSRVGLDSPNAELKSEWYLLETWMAEELATNAPEGVAKAYFSSFDFWLWDTSANVYQTAIDSAAIAIAVTGVVILLSSRSVSLTLFSSIGVFFVLASVTAIMVALGWTLGFLESICFTILIGLSGDFIIHFGHAYTEPPANTDRHARTKYALLHLGPSVLAAGFTTLSGAFIMLFCKVYFFQIFAMALFFAIIQATVGSFVVFLTLTDCMGPVNPTYLFDKLLCMDEESKARRKAKRERKAEDEEKRKAVRVDAKANFKQREKEHREFLKRKKAEKQERKGRPRASQESSEVSVVMGTLARGGYNTSDEVSLSNLSIKDELSIEVSLSNPSIKDEPIPFDINKCNSKGEMDDFVL